MTSALLIGTVLAAEVLFNGAKNASGTTYSKSEIENNGKNATTYGGYGTLCDVGYWGDGSPFSEDNVYLVRSGWAATIGAAGATEFTAPNLHLGIKDNTSGWLVFQTPSSVTLPEVYVGFGGFIVYGTASGEAVVSAPKITVDSSNGNPVEVKNYYQPAQGVKFAAPFYGPATSVLKVNNWYDQPSIYGAWTYFAGDMSNYLGLIHVGKYHRLKLDGNSNPNRVVMERESELWCGSTQYKWFEPVVVDDLSVTNGTRVKVAVTDAQMGGLKVNSKLSLKATNKEKLTIDLFMSASTDAIPYCSSESHERTLVDLPVDVSELAETVKISNSNNSKFWPYLVFTEESVGDRSQIKVKMPKRANVFKLPPSGQSSLAVNSCWENVGEEESLEDYLLIAQYISDSRKNSLMLMKSNDPAATETFGGVLLLGREIYVAQYTHEEFADLRLMPGAKWSVIRNATSNIKLDGVITVYEDGADRADDGYASIPDYFYFEYDATTLTINAMIKGRGTIAFRPWAANTYQGGTFVLAGNNSSYAGRFEVAHRDDGKKMTLKVSSTENLGGPLAGFLKDAVRVGNHGVLEATDSFLLDEPTRGVNVLGGGTIKVDAEKTMSIASTLTLSGAATKSGAGTLELCGTVVTENDATLAVTEGALKATTCTALSGCAVNFSDGAALTVDGDSFDDEYLAKGIDLASTTLTTGDELLVKIESIQAVGPNRKVAIATDTNAKAAELAAKLTAKLVLASGSEKSCAVSCEANEDGVTSTIWADCTRKGMTLFIK